MKRETKASNQSNSSVKKKPIFVRPKTFLECWRLATGFLWLFCTLLLLLPKPWVMFWNRNLVEEFGIGYEHLYMFIVLGFFVELSERRMGVFIWLNILCIYGLLTEFLQTYIPPRTCDMVDFCQDCTGAYIGVTIGFIVKKLLIIRNRKP